MLSPPAAGRGADKAAKAQAIRGRIAQGKLYLPRNAPWVADLVSELLRFPTGRNDDQVDVLSLFGRMLRDMSGPWQPPQNVARGVHYDPFAVYDGERGPD